MKKSLLVTGFLFSFFISRAQDISFGPEAGLNLNFASAKKTDGKIKGYPGLGFQFGGFGDYAFTDEVSLHPQLIFSYESVAQEPFAGNKVNGSVFYLKIPVDVFYHSPLANGKVFFGFGPFLGVALTGSYKLKFTGSNESIPISFGNDSLQNDLRRLDAGLQFAAGYEVTEEISVMLNFDLGLPDVSTPDNVKAHTRSIGISAAYRFKVKK